MILDDNAILDKADELLADYQHRLGLDDWHIELEVIGNGDTDRCEPLTGETCPAGKTYFDYPHREAIIMLNRDVVADFSGQGIAYILGHEIGHIMATPFQEVINTIGSLVPAKLHPALHSVVDDRWRWEDEKFAHFIARALGAKQPPADFWVTEQKGYSRSVYHD